MRLRLTPSGRKLHTYYIAQYHGWLAKQIADISEEDIRTTAATIAKLYAIMSERKPKLEGTAPQTNRSEVQPHD